jgi:hypothetical protein
MIHTDMIHTDEPLITNKEITNNIISLESLDLKSEIADVTDVECAETGISYRDKPDISTPDAATQAHLNKPYVMSTLNDIDMPEQQLNFGIDYGPNGEDIFNDYI